MTFLEQTKEVKDPSTKIIIDYLLSREDIKTKLDNDKKTIERMMMYIRNEAKKFSQNGFACIEYEKVFGWAVHYYDEDDLEIDKEEAKKPIKKANETKPVKEFKNLKSENQLKKRTDATDHQISIFEL